MELEDRIVFNNCHLQNCTEDHCLVGPAIFRNCSIDGLRTQEGGIRIDGALFDQVTIKGDVGTFRVMSDATCIELEFDAALHQANRDLYADVDWAIDISTAFAKDLTLYGIPPELIRYDPQRQAIVRRKNVEHSFSTAIEACGKTIFGVCIDNLRYFPNADNVCFTTPSNGDVESHNKVISELRRLGFADEAPRT
ncbi:MAG: hypothetical protein R3B84_22505 [Zavarzinella sp.]